jgi:arylsulfatase A-like enzyme
MPSVALVVLDTLRKESFDRHFEWLPGVRFEEAWSHSGWTVAAHGSLFTGLYPSETGVYAKTERLDCERPVLAERLSNHGFSTRAFSANAYVTPTFDFDRGFDTFDITWRGRRREGDMFEWGEFISETQGAGPSRFLKALYACLTNDVDTLGSLKVGFQLKARDLGLAAFGGDDDGAKEAREFVRSTAFGSDEFLFLNLMEAHSPYNPPEKYRTVETDASPGIDATVGDGPDADPADIEQAYDDSVRYLSDVYEDIFAELADDFDYVVTLGDHGECFGEHDVWSHNYGVNPELTHVPLCLYRGREERQTRDATVGLVDVYQTILELADVPPGDTRGQNVLEDPTSRPQLTERFGLTRSHVENLESTGLSDDEIESWDATLRGVALPGGGYGWETRSGFEMVGTTVDAQVTSQRLDELVEQLDVREVDVVRTEEVDSAVRDRLERLGYA